MKLFSTISLALLIAGFAVLGSPQETIAQQKKQIMLAGYKHNPPVATSGSGMVTVELQKDTLTVHGSFENLTNRYSGAYIMVIMKGDMGNQLYRLKVDLNEEKTGGTLKAEKNTFVLSKAAKELLKSGELAINIATFDNQQGEIMSKIPPMG